jgi:MFS transporter, PAT family, beta-lactamase induction signal transducer AmpG
MLLLGFSAGVPILLIFSSLSLWLREAGVEKSSVTYFSWAALGYSFKFVWAPLVDRLPLPLLGRLGRRRSWILFSQLIIMVAIFSMGMVDPASSQGALTSMALAAVLLGFSSATQDIGIDAYRIECDSAEFQALLSSSYIAGYRIGMIVAGAGALFLASGFGTAKGAYQYEAWQSTYTIMALVMLVGVLTTLTMPEPKQNSDESNELKSTADYLRFFGFFLLAAAVFVSVFFWSGPSVTAAKLQLSESWGNRALASFVMESFRLFVAVGMAALAALIMVKLSLVRIEVVQQTYVEPVKDFFVRYGFQSAVLLLALIGLYRISDIVLGVISNVFYQDLGFTKNQIASVVKTFGLIMTIVGGFLGGMLTVRFGVMRILFWGAVLSAATNLLFMLLASMGQNEWMLYLVISADNLSAGLASAAFIAFLSSLTNVSFTAVQYAIFSSLMTLFPKILGGYSGSMAETLGYQTFFAVTALLGVPVLIVIAVVNRSSHFKIKGD